jgi:hypothetical protein
MNGKYRSFEQLLSHTNGTKRVQRANLGYPFINARTNRTIGQVANIHQLRGLRAEGEPLFRRHNHVRSAR